MSCAPGLALGDSGEGDSRHGNLKGICASKKAKP